MKFLLLQILVTLASLVASGPVPDASAEAVQESWVTLARTLNSDPNAVIDITPEGELVSLVDGRVIDSVQLSEEQVADVLATKEKPAGKRGGRRSPVPNPAESVGLAERQVFCRSVRCYLQSGCTVYPECYLCASFDGYCY